MNVNYLKNPNHVACLNEEEVLPRLARELGISDLARRVSDFRANPTPEGVSLSGLKRTTLKLFVPDLTFNEHLDQGEKVWIYLGETCPAYCLTA